MKEWISVKEKLPDEWISVLGFIPGLHPYPSVRECYRVGNGFYFPALHGYIPVTHWMEMPEPPKEET